MAAAWGGISDQTGAEGPSLVFTVAASDQAVTVSPAMARKAKEYSVRGWRPSTLKLVVFPTVFGNPSTRVPERSRAFEPENTEMSSMKKRCR